MLETLLSCADESLAIRESFAAFCGAISTACDVSTCFCEASLSNQMTAPVSVQIEELAEYMPGPDFPTGGQILGSDG